jgi:hypothetical protein
MVAEVADRVLSDTPFRNERIVTHDSIHCRAQSGDGSYRDVTLQILILDFPPKP